MNALNFKTNGNMISKEDIVKALVLASTKPDGSMGMDIEEIEEVATELDNQQMECKIEIKIDSKTKRLVFKNEK